MPTISVTFQNFLIDQHTWTITDLGSNTVVFNSPLNGRDDPDPNTSKTTVSLASDGVVGNAQYQNEGEAQPTQVQQLTDGQIVNMN